MPVEPREVAVEPDVREARVVVHDLKLYYTILYCTVLYYTVLYNTIVVGTFRGPL